MTQILASFFETHLSTSPHAIAVAVSGGADSFALLHMAHKWASDKNILVSALTVDHALRPESRNEVESVARWCNEHNIAHEILTWQTPKPSTGIQEAARNARRELLCDACQRLGIPFLLLGHQADDQAETLFMRMQRGTGLHGLKSIEPVTHDPQTGITILRPLLELRRAELRAYCQTHHLPFIDDPSNEDLAFERVRIRQTLSTLPEMAEGVAKTALRLRRANDTLNQLAQNWVDEFAITLDNGAIWLPERLRGELLPEIFLRVLHLVVNTLKRQRLSVTKLEKLQQALQANDFKAITIAGIWIQVKLHGGNKGFLFQPEPPRRM